jgi:monothiol glutaredoxin
MAMTEPTLKDKVEELIRENKVLLFMKGTPEAPQCGFSMRTVNVLESSGVEYGAVDVIGELVGGCDIVVELDESGELAGLLGVEQPERPAMSAKQELQADPQQSPPIQIQR